MNRIAHLPVAASTDVIDQSISKQCRINFHTKLMDFPSNDILFSMLFNFQTCFIQIISMLNIYSLISKEMVSLFLAHLNK